MENKIIITKVRDNLSQVIGFLNDSYNKNIEQFYSVNDVDTPVASANDGLSCTAVFVIFRREESLRKDEVIRLYVGNGRIEHNGIRWVIFYQIKKIIESPLVVNNFISNSELDLKNDFDICSYVNIEDTKELIDQICFVFRDPYNKPQKSYENQLYDISTTEAWLHEFSQKNEHCKRPIGLLSSHPNRLEFQRDYERIVHTKAYRRLVDKAQIFTSEKGDHYRTRMTHTQEVAQIARAIATGLKLNITLTEAIALAHDLGHTPFGHQGERTLDDILKGKIKIIKEIPDQNNVFGGFKHNFQGLRVVDYLEENYIEFEGMDLSYQVLEGILKHTKGKIKDCSACDHLKACDQKCFDLIEMLANGSIQYLYPQYPDSTTLEGQIVTIADEIAQRSHDLDDSFSAGIINSDELINYLSFQKMSNLRMSLQEIKQNIKNVREDNRQFIDVGELLHSRIVSVVIDCFITDVIKQSSEKIKNFTPNELYEREHRFHERLIDFSYSGKVLCDYLEKIISKKVINSPEVVRFDNKASLVVRNLFEAYYYNPKLLHEGTLRRIYIETRKFTPNVIDFLNGDLDMVKKEIDKIVNGDISIMQKNEAMEYSQKRKILVRAIADYISGMTDNYALDEYSAIYIAK